MGQVYSATDTRLHRTVAIKVLPPDKIADADRKRRFMQEARAASALNHRNIITLHDIASSNGVDDPCDAVRSGQTVEITHHTREELPLSVKLTALLA